MNRLVIAAFAVLLSASAHAQLNGPVSVIHPIGPALDPIYMSGLEPLSMQDPEVQLKKQNDIAQIGIKHDQRPIVRIEDGLLLLPGKPQAKLRPD